jgi:hypothetical protein
MGSPHRITGFAHTMPDLQPVIDVCRPCCIHCSAQLHPWPCNAYADLCAGKVWSDGGLQCREPSTCDPLSGQFIASAPAVDGTNCTASGGKPGSCICGSCALRCVAGQGGTGCDFCARGTFSVGGSDLQPGQACTACPAFKSTASIGSTSVGQCSGESHSNHAPMTTTMYYLPCPEALV